MRAIQQKACSEMGWINDSMKLDTIKMIAGEKM